jgi:hypothetical protein
MAEVGRRIKRIKNQLHINGDWLERHKNIRTVPYAFYQRTNEIRRFMNLVQGQMFDLPLRQDINDRNWSVVLMKLLPPVRI